MLVFNDTEEKAVKKAIAVLADMIPLEAGQQKAHLHKDRFRHGLQVRFRGMTTK